MHQTTIRFGNDLWEALAAAAQREGVSVAQYVREAAVARLAQAEQRGAAPPVGAGQR
ncbi:ribbon-helix-helix domain-containing protein, partial [Patulibacter sp. S7RM1-6]